MPKFGDPSTQEEPTPPSTVKVFESTRDAFTPKTNPSTAPAGSPYAGLSDQAQLVKLEMEKIQMVKDQEKQEEHWAKAYWRPAMGWLYMVICACDFIIFPVVAMFLPMITGTPYVAWKSMTLDNGGLIHMAFGAILGVAAWTRGQEKIAGKN